MQNHAGPCGPPLGEAASSPGTESLEASADVTRIESELGKAIAAHAGELGDAIAAIATRLDYDTERAAARERVIDHLHAEVERLRSAELTGVLRPVIVDLCRLRDDLLRQASTLSAELTTGRCAELLASYAESVGESLERCGVGVLPTEVGSRFDPGQQRVTQLVDVDDPDLDDAVIEVVRDGYIELDGNKIIAPARIKLGRVPSVRESNNSNLDHRKEKENADG